MAEETERQHSTPELILERLILNRLTEQDAKDMYEGWMNSPAATRWMFLEPRKSIGQCIALLQSMIQRYETDTGYHQWAIRSGSGCIGTIALFVDPANNAGRLAYVLRENAWGKGYMTEAVRAVIAFGFEQLGLNRISGDCFMENAPSGRVMEKAGMLLEGVLRQGYRKFGAYHDVVLYGILKENHK